jgi:nucleoside-diphosphate-sugar epimerase
MNAPKQSPRLLIVGGSGAVGSLVLKPLSDAYAIRVLDLKAPPDGEWEYVPGSVDNVADVTAAAEDCEAMIYLATGSLQDRGSPRTIASHFDVNVKCVYLALHAAHEAGLSHTVYASSMSVFRTKTGLLPNEASQPDQTAYYGFTKSLGEQVCAAACDELGVSVNVLRLAFPTADAAWPRASDSEYVRTLSTSASDLARALVAAVEFRAGCHIFTITGDWRGTMTDLSKAEELLGWRPLSRPAVGA